MNSRSLKAGLQFATVALLLLTVAGLSTLAKNSQYFPKSNPTHYVNSANKMKAAAPPVVFERAPLQLIARVVPPRPCAPKTRGIEEVSLSLPSIGVTVSIQHRSPPSRS